MVFNGYATIPKAPGLEPHNRMGTIRWGVSYSPVELHSKLGLSNTSTASLQRDNPTNQCPGYDIKQSYGEVPVMLELWRMWSTSSLPSLPGHLWPGLVAPGRDLSMG